jgi:hypothetical protein
VTVVIIAAYFFLLLHLPGGREVTIAVSEIVSMRDGEHKGEYVTPEVGCMINTEDGKFISVTESCQTVRDLIKEELKNLENKG